MAVEIKVLNRGDEAVLANVAPGVFDHDVNERLVHEFLDDPRHHIVVGIENGQVIGFVSALHYVHPDKPAELWINEVAVAPTCQGRGHGKALLSAMLDLGREIGCAEAWVLTDRPNTRAMRLYSSLGGQESDAVMFSFRLNVAKPDPTGERQ
jgi:ribosomal protein S18 acetylase RimI-like enzyme